MEYRYYVRQLALESYLFLIAVFFTVLGIWVGLQLLRRSGKAAKKTTLPINTNKIKELKISPREQEVLQLISEGYSNQEIADKLFVSLSTVKTHSSSLFSKLDVKRRTQAVQAAKALRILL
jgi:NarL family two-component system response regulator LiaR